jgi:hypothetical protein
MVAPQCYRLELLRLFFRPAIPLMAQRVVSAFGWFRFDHWQGCRPANGCLG